MGTGVASGPVGKAASSEPFRPPDKGGLPAECGGGCGHQNQKPSLWIERTRYTLDGPAGKIGRYAQTPGDDITLRAATHQRPQFEKAPSGTEYVGSNSGNREPHSPGPLRSKSLDEHGPISESSDP